MKARPLKNRLLVKIVETEEVKDGGIYLMDVAEGEPQVARVIATPDCIDDDQDILLRGDRILLTPQAGYKIMMDGDEYLMVSQQDILAVLDG